MSHNEQRINYDNKRFFSRTKVVKKFIIKRNQQRIVVVWGSRSLIRGV